MQALQHLKKRNRSELEGNSTSSKTGNSQLDIMSNLVRSVNKLAQSIDSMDAKDGILSRKYQIYINGHVTKHLSYFILQRKRLSSLK